MSDYPQYANASDFRYILDVMEECSHLGLDNHTAFRLRQVLAQRIATAENEAVRKTVFPSEIAVEESELIA